MSERIRRPTVAGLGLGLGGESEWKSRALEFAATARESLSESTKNIRKSIEEQPAQALGLALGMGVLLGWLIKRR